MLLKLSCQCGQPIEVDTDTDGDKLIELMKQDEKMRSYIDGKEIVKEIVVKNKLVNIVVK